MNKLLHDSRPTTHDTRPTTCDLCRASSQCSGLTPVRPIIPGRALFVATAVAMVLCIFIFPVKAGEEKGVEDLLKAETRREEFRKNLEVWKRLPPERKRLLRERYEGLRNLSPERRKIIQQNFRKYQALPPPERERLRKRAEEFRRLSPEKRRILLARRRYWNSLPPERKRKIRQALHLIKKMPEEERQELLSLSPEERKARIRQLLREKNVGATVPGRP